MRLELAAYLALVALAFAVCWMIAVPAADAALRYKRREIASLPDESASGGRSASEPTWELPATPARRLGAGAAGAASMAAMCAGPVLSGAVHPAAGVACLAAIVLMLVIALCDVRAMIIPYQGCALMALAAVLLAILFNADRIASAALGSLACLAALVLAGRLVGGDSLGAGDIRLIPWVAFACGWPGMLVGLVVCFALLAVQAAALMATKHATRKSLVPMAPALALWLVVGFTAQTLNAFG